MGQPPYVAIARKAYDSDIFWTEKRTFSRWEAWEDIIQLAAWAAHRFTIPRGEVVMLERGETPPLSLSYLSARWQWTTKQVRYFLRLCQKEGRLQPGQRTQLGHTYVLVNYVAYQPLGAQAGQGQGTPRAHLGQETETGKEEKEGKRDTARPKQERKGRLPETWEPDESHRRIATEKELSVVEELERFRDWARAGAVTRADWSATFRNWLRNDRYRGNGRPQGKSELQLAKEKAEAVRQREESARGH